MGRRRGEERRGGPASMHRCARTLLSDCPSVPYVLNGPVGPWDQRDGRIADYVHFRFTRMRCAATRISRRSNKLRSQSSYTRARIVGHAGRRRRRRQRSRADASLKPLSALSLRLPKDEGPSIHSWPRRRRHRAGKTHLLSVRVVAN